MASMGMAQGTTVMASVPSRQVNPDHLLARRTHGARRIRMHELPVFTRSLSTMLSAGLPVIESLTTLEAQTASLRFRDVVRGVRRNVESGLSLPQAMARHPDVFDTMYVGTLRIGEASGRAAENLGRLADYLESAVELRRKVRAAMSYPVVVAVIAFALATAIMVWIVPTFEEIYREFGGTLPTPTRVLIRISRIIRHAGLPLLVIVPLLALGLRALTRRPSGAYVLDYLKLHLPVFGRLFHKIALCRFAESLAQMLHTGVPILHAMELASHATGNAVLARTILLSRTDVERGDPLSSALRRYREYDPILITMLTAGEKTGRADEMLDRVATFYRNEVNNMLKELTSMVEPLLIVVLGVVIGGMVICMFLPIFRMHQMVTV